MTDSKDYVQAGLALVPIPYASKGPTHQGWNTIEKCITTVRRRRFEWTKQLGLAHATPRPCTAALDIDDFRVAAAWLADRGIDLPALLMAGVRCRYPVAAKIGASCSSGCHA